MSGASEQVNERTSGPVLQSVFSAVLDHSVQRKKVGKEIKKNILFCTVAATFVVVVVAVVVAVVVVAVVVAVVVSAFTSSSLSLTRSSTPRFLPSTLGQKEELCFYRLSFFHPHSTSLPLQFLRKAAFERGKLGTLFFLKGESVLL